jgi:hypothetical protein
MTPRKKDTEPTKAAFEFVDLITGRIGKIGGLLIAVGVILTQSELIRNKITALGLYTPSPCVQAEPLIMPATVKYSEWDSMKLKLKGRNNCSTPFGLFVTYIPRSASETNFVVKVPHESLPECTGRAQQEPKCWDGKRPVSSGKGDWEWEFLPPPLARLSDPRRIEKISIAWYVYDYDAPAKSAILVGNSTIEVHNDGANPS